MKTLTDYLGRSYELPDAIVERHEQAQAIVTRATVACGPDEFCALELRGDGTVEYVPCGKHGKATFTESDATRKLPRGLFYGDKP